MRHLARGKGIVCQLNVVCLCVKANVDPILSFEKDDDNVNGFEDSLLQEDDTYAEGAPLR